MILNQLFVLAQEIVIQLWGIVNAANPLFPCVCRILWSAHIWVSACVCARACVCVFISLIFGVRKHKESRYCSSPRDTTEIDGIHTLCILPPPLKLPASPLPIPLHTNTLPPLPRRLTRTLPLPSFSFSLYHVGTYQNKTRFKKTARYSLSNMLWNGWISGQCEIKPKTSAVIWNKKGQRGCMCSPCAHTVLYIHEFSDYAPSTRYEFSESCWDDWLEFTLILTSLQLPS